MREQNFGDYTDYAAWYASEWHNMDVASVETVGEHAESWTCEVYDLFGEVIELLVWRADNDDGFEACENDE